MRKPMKLPPVIVSFGGIHWVKTLTLGVPGRGLGEMGGIPRVVV